MIFKTPLCISHESDGPQYSQLIDHLSGKPANRKI